MKRRFRFDRCELLAHERQLLIDGTPARIGARAFDVLLALVERSDRVVSKAELLDLAWPGLVVEENNLSVQISALRRLLGPHAISTVPMLGYHFAAEVDEVPAPAAMPALAALAAPDPPATCVVCVRMAAADSVATARHAIDAHGGQAIDDALRHRLLARFPSAHSAVACAHALHRAHRHPHPVGVAVHREAQPVDAVTRQACDLAEVVPFGETWITSHPLADLVHKLDGDVEELGRKDRVGISDTLRVFRVTAPEPSHRSAGEPPTGVLDPLPTLAVLPFRPYATDAEPVRLGDVITDQVIVCLSKCQTLNVISRLSTSAFRDRDEPLSQIATCLAADFVISGRYLISSDKVRVQVELAAARTNRVIWSDSVVDHPASALQIDSDMVTRLVSGITQAIFASELRLLRTAALPDLATHTLMLAGIGLMFRLSPRDFALSHSALQAVHERAPRHATPLAWLARWHLFRLAQGWSEDRSVDGRQAMDLARRALDIDPDSSLALTMLGSAHTVYLQDPVRGERLLDQALDLNPNESLAWLQKGNARSFAGDGAAALEHVQRATQLSPLDPARHYYLTILAGAALTAQDFERASAAARESLRFNREHASTHRVLAIALAMTGRVAEAKACVEEVLRIEPQLTVAGYIARSPAKGSALAQTFADALRAAGLPSGADIDQPATGG